MFIREVGKFLNMQGHISFRDSGKLLEISDECNLDGICKVRARGDSAYIITNLARRTAIKEVAEKLKNVGCTETPDAYKYVDETMDPGFTKLFLDLVKIPSVVIDAVFMHSGVRHVVFRFHDTNLRSVSTVLLSGNKLNDFSVLHLGKNVGLDYLLDVDCDLNTLYYEIEATIPPSSMDIIGDPVITTFGDNWHREVKYLLDENIEAVYYEKSKILNESPQLKEISAKDKTYRMTFQNPLVSRIFSRSTEDKITILGMQHQMSGPKFRMGMIVPEVVAADFHKILSDVFTEFKDWKIVIMSAASLRTALSR